MSGGGRPFEAWALPAGVPPAGGPSLEYETGGLRVRYPAATPKWIGRIATLLGEARRGLLERRAADVAAALGRVGDRFLEVGDPLRAEALELLPATSGLSAPMAAAVLDGMAADWRAERLQTLLNAEMEGGAPLDGFVLRDDGACRRLRAVGPRLCVQIVAGTVPGVGVTALLRSLLVKGPTLLKPGRGDEVLPVLFARALREEDAELADAAAVLYWPGGSEAVEEAALREADVVAAYGDDATVSRLRGGTPVTARFVAYHHRLSLGVMGRGALDAKGVRRAASEVAGALAFFDQRGCVSPQVVYVVEGGEIDPRGFATLLAETLASLEGHLPGGVLDGLEASTLHQLRGTTELLAASGSGVEIRHGGAASWTVIWDPSPEFTPTCVGRVVRVKPVAHAARVAELVAPYSAHLQTVAVAGLGGETEAVAEALARVGVTRVTAFADVPFPPPWWHHDGLGPLGALVRWVDLDA
ncbi:MAG: hypothetical protein LJF06_13965 [Gemmatimonadetes bacterium]|nr:hypothetical protein [Gemmatimonadota bacterium]